MTLFLGLMDAKRVEVTRLEALKHIKVCQEGKCVSPRWFCISQVPRCMFHAAVSECDSNHGPRVTAGAVQITGSSGHKMAPPSKCVTCSLLSFLRSLRWSAILVLVLQTSFPSQQAKKGTRPKFFSWSVNKNVQLALLISY